MTYKASPGYVTRTLQGLYGKEGGFAQPVTLREVLRTRNMELYIGVQGQEWTPITKIEISKQDPVLIWTEYQPEPFGTKYVNAVRARVRKDK